MPTVLIALAPGFEEIEAVTVIDLLRRANIAVTVAGLVDGSIKGRSGTVIVPDTTLDQAMRDDYDMLVLPGGEPGATNLQRDARVAQLIRKMQNDRRRLGAICAAPRVLAEAGALDGRRATCYTGAIDPKKYPRVHLDDVPVITDNNVTTSRGPGTAMEFALELIEQLSGEAKRKEVEAPLLRAR